MSPIRFHSCPLVKESRRVRPRLHLPRWRCASDQYRSIFCSFQYIFRSIARLKVNHRLKLLSRIVPRGNLRRKRYRTPRWMSPFRRALVIFRTFKVPPPPYVSCAHVEPGEKLKLALVSSDRRLREPRRI